MLHLQRNQAATQAASLTGSYATKQRCGRKNTCDNEKHLKISWNRGHSPSLRGCSRSSSQLQVVMHLCQGLRLDDDFIYGYHQILGLSGGIELFWLQAISGTSHLIILQMISLLLAAYGYLQVLLQAFSGFSPPKSLKTSWGKTTRWAQQQWGNTLR